MPLLGEKIVSNSSRFSSRTRLIRSSIVSSMRKRVTVTGPAADAVGAVDGLVRWRGSTSGRRGRRTRRIAGSPTPPAVADQQDVFIGRISEPLDDFAALSWRNLAVELERAEAPSWPESAQGAHPLAEDECFAAAGRYLFEVGFEAPESLASVAGSKLQICFSRRMSSNTCWIVARSPISPI